MVRYIALLRAVNVGGTGKLQMRDLVALSEQCGFSRVRTVLASGNVIFDAETGPEECLTALLAALHSRGSGSVGVQIRTPAALTSVLSANPFQDRPPNRVLVTFLSEPPREVLERVAGRTDEDIRCKGKEIYVYYPAGQGASRLRLPAAEAGTARNINTIAKLANMAGEV